MTQSGRNTSRSHIIVAVSMRGSPRVAASGQIGG
jgi:hypothetical protein